MDKVDKKILKELLENARKPHSKIGKNVLLSRENVHYRIKNLEKQNIIKDYVTLIDYEALGYEQFTIFIELDKIDEEKEREILTYLKKQPSISWIGVLSGNWSITCDIHTKTIEDLNTFITKFFNKYEEHIGEYQILSLQESNYYFQKIIDETVKHKHTQKETLKIDETDVELLKELNHDARISYVELGKRVKLTPNAAKGRVQKLERSVIEGYSISIDHKQFGLEWHGIQIQLRRPSKEIEDKLKNVFEADKQVIFYYHYNKFGSYDFDIGVVVKDSGELREFINKLRKDFYEEIQICNTFLVLEEVSSHNLPKTMFT